MRILFKIFLFCIFLAFLAAGSLYKLSEYSDAPGRLAAEKIIVISSGTGAFDMAFQLKREEITSQPYAFLAMVALFGVGGELKAGEYKFEANISLSDVIEKIVNGDVFVRKVTVPEGMSSFEVAALINAAAEMRGEAATPPEGSVLPETYVYQSQDDRAKMLAQMQAAMARTLDELWLKRAANLPFDTKEQALALASVVEKETGVGAERARIAGVFVNRLRLGMRLQSDPTVIYAITKGTSKIERVLYAHLETDSPYNTYRYAGIPAGPICNPGKAAIEAVLNPETHDFLYFVADGTGGHVFARGLDEHNANVAKWRAVQRAQAR